VPDAPNNEHFRTHVQRLRDTYVKATPGQRAHVARQRMQHQGATANVLISFVSATEGMARSVLLMLRTASDVDVGRCYSRIRGDGPEDLLKKIAVAHGTTAPKLFGSEEWRLFGWAVKYRNLLIHEATFLNQVDGGWLVRAAEDIFLKLEELGTVRAK